MSNRQINRIQNILLFTLAILAVIWLTQLLSLTDMSEKQTTPITSSAEAETALLSAVHLAITADNSYGRFGQLNLSTDSTVFLQVFPLLREAIGSAQTASHASHGALQTQLSGGSLFVDFATALPMEILTHWLDTDSSLSGNFTAVALISASPVMLYLLSDDGSWLRCATSLPASAVDALTSAYTPNGCHFAFETESLPLSPYALLPEEMVPIADAASSLPAGYSSYHLLSAVGLNAYTNSRYTETGGTEVIVEGNHTLRMTPDGFVLYQGDQDTSLYTADRANPLVGAWEAACQVANDLTDATGASPLRLYGIQETADGWQVEFVYQLQDLPVRFSNGQPALSVLVQEGVVSSFSYYCRSYRQLDSETTLLPPAMAAAIATGQQGQRFSLAYVDDGSGLALPCWLMD